MRRTSHIQHQALLALRILLDDQAPRADLASLDWSTLLPLARENAVLLSLAKRLREAGGELPDAVCAAVDEERDRVRRLFELASRLGDNCRRHRIHYMFPKLAQHHPDTGRDLDLLVLDLSLHVDHSVLDGVSVNVKATTIQGRLARTTTYLVEPGGLEVDIHHGRLGALAEHRRLPEELIEHGECVTLDAGRLTVPAPEYQFVLQGVQKAWGRSSFRLAEIVYTHRCVRNGLDWMRVLDLASEHHVLHSVSCYLSYAEQVHREARLGPLLPESVRSRLALTGWGHVRFHRARFRFPALRVHGRTYAAVLRRAAATADWPHVERLTLAPIRNAAGALRPLSLLRRLRGGAVVPGSRRVRSAPRIVWRSAAQRHRARAEAVEAARPFSSR